MGDVVNVKLVPTADDSEFVADLARYKELLVDEPTIRKRYRLTDDVWEKLALDDELVRAIENESVRRVRSGQQKRERAQQYAVKIPEVAASIAFDASASPRHRLDAGHLIDKLSANEPGASTSPADRFVITINLGADLDGKEVVQRFSKSIAVDPNDVDPFNDVDVGAIAAIAAKKPRSGGGGGNAL